MKRLIAILFILAGIGANAQNQVIDPTVEVNRDYQGKMMEIAKGKLSTAAADSLGVFNLNFNYSFFEKPYKDMYEFSAVPSASIPKEAAAAIPAFVAKAGMGYPLAPEAAIWFSPQLEGDNFLNLNGNFNMFNGKVPAFKMVSDPAEGLKIEESGEKFRNKEYGYRAGAKYTHAWRSGELDLYGKFTGGYSTYCFVPEEHHNYNLVEGGLGAKSSGAGKYGKKLNWGIKGLFRHTADKKNTSLKENYAAIEGELGPTFGRYNKFMVGIGIEWVQYNGNPGYYKPEYYMGLFGINPEYKYENGNFKINLGLKVEGKFSNEENVNQGHSYILPDIDLLLMLAQEKLWLYAKAVGWNSLNTYSSLLEKNRWMNPDYVLDDIKESSVPLHLEGGFKGRFTDKFSYRIYAGYAIHKYMQQFAYEEGWFTTTHSDHNQFFAGAQLAVATERFNGEVSAQYSSYSNAMEGKYDTGIKPFGVPRLESDIKMCYNWSSKVYTEVACHLQGKYYTSANRVVCTVPGFADLGASAGYEHSPALTFWLRGTNLLNSATQYMPFYTGRGVGIQAGIIVKL